MELRRLTRVVRERWRPVALLAVVGFLAAFGLTYVANADPQERYRVDIPVRFEPDEGETAEDVSTRIDNAFQLALLATSEVTAEHPEASIFPNNESGRLFFRGEADTPAEALAIAQELVAAYFTSDSLGGGDVSDDLAALEAKATSVAEQLETLQPGLTTDEQVLAARHDLLDSVVEALKNQIVSQTVAGALGDNEAADDQAIAALQSELDAAIAARAALGPRPQTELTASEELRRSALQRQLDLLTIEYETLALRAEGVGAAGTREPPEPQDLTPDPANPMVNGIVGLMGGAGLALAGLVFVARSRREAWLPEDFPIPVLGEVPPRRVSLVPGPSWYDSTFTGPRKESIQALRTVVDGIVDSALNAFAIAGDRVDPAAVHALAADLAASFASAGRSVLLIDADFESQTEITEFQVGEPTLGSILASAARPDIEGHMSRLLDEVVVTRTDLAVVAAGPAPHSPADVLAGRAFRTFVATARQQFDLVIAVAGEAYTATAQVLMQRMESAIVVTAPGSTTIPRINAVLSDLNQQRVHLPGVVLFSRRSPSSLPRRIAAPVHLEAAKPEAEATSRSPSQAVSRLGSYPFPGSKRVSTGVGSLQGLSSNLALNAYDVDRPAPSNDSLGIEILEALKATRPDRSLEVVADYVVARVEDMLTAVPGQANASQELIDRISDYGFIPISPTKGHETIGGWFVSEIVDEVGPEVGPELAEALVQALAGDPKDPVSSLNRWIGAEFFKRHCRRTEREPVVWHVESETGLVQLLVNAHRLTAGRIRQIATEVVARKIDELERSLKVAMQDGDEGSVDDIQKSLKEVHQFGISFSQLLGTGNEEARLVYPWRRADSARPAGWEPIWSEGIRPNIAPLQRMGLLPIPVLTPDELSDLVRSA